MKTLLVVLALVAQGNDILIDKNDEEFEGQVKTMTYKQVAFNRLVGGEFIPQQFDAWDVKQIKLGSRANNPFELQKGMRKMDEADFKGALKLFVSVSKNTRNTGVARQYALYYAARAQWYEGDLRGARSTIQNLRTQFSDTYFLRETFDLEYNLAKMAGDSSGMETAVKALQEKAKQLNLASWKVSAEIKQGELWEFQKKYKQAKDVYKKYARDRTIGLEAKLGEMRCLSALKEFRDLKSKCSSIIRDSKSKKKIPMRLLMGAYVGMGDVKLMSEKDVKAALLDYLRVVVDLSKQHGESSMEHELSLAKAAQAAALYAGEQKDQNIKDQYRTRARGLLEELEVTYGRGTALAKQVQKTINEIP